jgi:hypothetical protein
VFDVFVPIHSDDPIDGTMRIAKIDLAYPEESEDFTLIDLLTPRMDASPDAVEIDTAQRRAHQMSDDRGQLDLRGEIARIDRDHAECEKLGRK